LVKQLTGIFVLLFIEIVCRYKKRRMNFQVEQISGNSYHVALLPVSPGDHALLEENSKPDLIENHYHQAIRQELGSDIRVASLTPDDDFPYSATIEVFSKSGSV
jgi:hypothetical protein